MNNAYFSDKTAPPDNRALEKLLGSLFTEYKEIIGLAASFDREWKYYGKTIGWQLKTTRKRKALFYLTPLEKSFRIAFAVRANERTVLLRSRLTTAATEQLRIAKRYPEGYPLRFTVSTKTDMRNIHAVLDVLRVSRE